LRPEGVNLGVLLLDDPIVSKTCQPVGAGACSQERYGEDERMAQTAAVLHQVLGEPIP
jgi:hypothetical protein